MREVTPRAWRAAVGVAGLAVAGHVALRGTGWPSLAAGAAAVGFVWIAHVFHRESVRAGGVTSARLGLAALATALEAAAAVVLAAEPFSERAAEAGPALRQALEVAAFAGYYAGLVAPRALRARCAERALRRYRRAPAGLAGEPRITAVSDDLQRAIGCAVASVVRAVLLFDAEQPGLLAVRATNTASWAGLAVAPGAGLVGRALSRRTPAVGAPADCEPPIADLAAASGRSVWVLPVANGGRRWGALVVVDRHASLFPDDDLEYAAMLCQHAAATLDHGQLVDAERTAPGATAGAALTRSADPPPLRAEFAVLIVDDAGLIREWTAGADALFGYTAARMCGQSAAGLFAQDRARFARLLADAQRAGHAEDTGRCQRHDGSEFPAHTTVDRVADGTARFVLVARDDSGRRAFGTRLQPR